MLRQHNLGDDGHLITNRRGSALCFDYNRGACRPGHNSMCPADGSKVHKCSKCLSIDQGAHECTKAATAPGQSSRQKKGKGKGKRGGAKGARPAGLTSHRTRGGAVRRRMRNDGRKRPWAIHGLTASGTAPLAGRHRRHARAQRTARKGAADGPGGTAGPRENPTAVGHRAEASSSSPCTSPEERARKSLPVPLCNLHLFSGPTSRAGGFAEHAKRLGAQCDEFDSLAGESSDLRDEEGFTTPSLEARRAARSRMPDAQTCTATGHSAPPWDPGGTGSNGLSIAENKKVKEGPPEQGVARSGSRVAWRHGPATGRNPFHYGRSSGLPRADQPLPRRESRQGDQESANGLERRRAHLVHDPIAHLAQPP